MDVSWGMAEGNESLAASAMKFFDDAVAEEVRVWLDHVRFSRIRSPGFAGSFVVGAVRLVHDGRFSGLP